MNLLRDFLSLWAWQHKSARIPQFLNLTTSKTKQFCETSSFFEVDNIKNKAILQDVLQKWKVECRADGLVQMRVAIFPLHLSKALRLPLPGHTKCCTCHAKSSQQTWRSDTPGKNPDLVTALVNMSLVLCLPLKMHLSRSSSNVTRLPSFLEMLQNPHGFTHFWQGAQSPSACHAKQRFKAQKWREHVVLFTFWLRNVLHATTACTFSSSQLPKVVRAWCSLHILTWKCATRHNDVHFFIISTSKNAPNVRCFYLFHWQMCFAPQWCALFRHLNFQKWSGPGVFCTFWLRNVLCAPSRHNGMQFFISHLASSLRTRRFSEPTFRPSGATNHWKNVFRDFPTFSRTWIFFLLRLFLFWSSFFFSLRCLFPSLLFICPYCRKFDF